ncbi:MAG: hypothetical protein AAGE98_08585 [Actinomycetota bacterium]
MSAPTDEVLLRIPARPEYGRLVRVGGAALGIRQGLSFAEIDELRLAIDEAVILLLDGSDADGDGELVATFRFDDGRLEVEMLAALDTELRDGAVDRFDEVCSPLIDDYDVDPHRGWLRLRKTPAPLD